MQKVSWLSEQVGLRILRWGSVVLATAGCVLWGSWAYFHERNLATAQAHENVALVRQYAQRLIQTQTILHGAAQAHAAGQSDPSYLRSEAFHRFLASSEASPSATYGVAVVGLDGTVHASSRRFPTRGRFTERDYLAGVRSGRELYIDRVKLEPAGQDSLVVAQPFVHGTFRGAIVSAVAIEEIRGFLRSIAGREGEAASLLRDDGKLLVRQQPSTPVFLEPSSDALRAIQTAGAGHFETEAVSDGVRRLYAYSQLSGLPLYANFGIPTSAIWTLWFWRSIPVWLLMLFGGTFSWTLGVLIRRSFRERLAGQEQARLRHEAEQRADQHATFMKELNHRIKNNLTLIDSMISLQMRRKGAVDAAELRARVRAIADVHDLLYRAADSYHVDLGELVHQICQSPAVVPRERNIELVCKTKPGFVLDAARATQLALIVVELVTNAVKHAFPDDRPGRITVALEVGDDEAELVIADDGVGMPKELARNSGLRIVRSFVEQVGGTIRNENSAGTRHRIEIPRAQPTASSTVRET